MPVRSKVQKFKVRVDHTNSDRSGLFIGVIGHNHSPSAIWNAAGVNNGPGGMGHPQKGSEYEVTVDELNDQIRFAMNGVHKGVHSMKLSQFPKPRSLGIFFYYNGNKATILGGAKGYFPIASRKFDIQVYRPKKFKMNLEFLKKGYGRGDPVRAFLNLERSEGGVPNATVESTCRIDGEEVFRKSYKCDTGKLVIDFILPDKEFVEGVGTLSCSVTDGVTENTSKTLPLILKKLKINLYPEGGELLLGQKNGLYFEALLPSGEPADFGGVLLGKDNSSGKVSAVTVCSTKHEGRGVVEFVPEKDKSYFLKVLKPTGVTEQVAVMKAKEVGLGIRLEEKKSLPFGEKFNIFLSATQHLQTIVILYRKNVIIDKTPRFFLTPGEERKISLNPKDMDGVLRITAYFLNEAFGVSELDYPVAERLVMIKPRRLLDFDIESDRKNYFPGQSVKLKIRPHICGKKDQSKDAFLCVTVTDDAVVKMKDKRKRPPRLLESVYLENEVKELNDPTSYLFPQEIKNIETFVNPEVCVDLLLGTQGWRRFVYKIQRKDHKFFEKGEFTKIEKEYFYRMLNLPNPEYKVAPQPVLKLGEPRPQHKHYRHKRPRKTGGKGGMIVTKDKSISRTMFGKKKKPKKKRKKRNKSKQVVLESMDVSDDDFFGGDVMDEGAGGMDEEEDKVMEVSSEKSSISLFKDSTFQDQLDIKPASIMEKLEEESEEEIDEEPPMPSVNRSSMRSGRGRTLGDYNVQKESTIHLVLRLPRERPAPKVQKHRYFREYAHAVSKKKEIGERSDFKETLYYCSVKKATKNKDEKYECEVNFCLSDSITTFLVKVDGFTTSGLLGSSSTFLLECSKPFYITPKLPLEVSMCDKVLIPVGIVNNIPVRCKCELEWKTVPEILDIPNKKWIGDVEEKGRSVQYFDMSVKSSFVKKEDYPVKVEGNLPVLRLMDSVKKSIKVKPYGFPAYFSYSGKIGKNEKRSHDFEIPVKKLVKNSIQTYAFISPSQLGTFAETCKSMIREPYGCFEQVSSTMYPMIMAKQILTTQNVVMDRNFLSRCDRFLQKGYAKLKGYEISGGGFDWYGNPPANESLTAMGLAQFIELSKIRSVDQEMIERTKNWLLSRKTATGFKRGSGRYAYGHAPENTTNAYIVWCLSRTHQINYDEVAGTIETCVQRATEHRDGVDLYVMALCALTMYNFGKIERSTEIIRKHMLKDQQKDGSFMRAVSTITRSGGNNKICEITALSCLALLNFPKENDFEIAAGKAVDFILSKNKNGCYYSTQSTVLCLQAIVKYFGAGGDEKGKVDLVLNGEVVSSIPIDRSTKAVTFSDFSQKINPEEKGKLEVHNNSDIIMPYSVNIACKLTHPPNDVEELPFQYSLKLGNEKINEGETTEIEVMLKNKNEKEDLPMIVAIVCLPGGLEPRIAKLKELKNQKLFDYYELFGAREVVFYWLGMKPEEVKKFKFDVVAEIPGEYTGDASRAYLYYDNECRYYLDGLKTNIVPKKK